MVIMQKYRSLLPQNNLNLENYQDAIDYALETDRIRNIALSGSYGSGKSSVINSYEQAHHDKRFIHITLADFKEQNLSVASSDKNAAENLKTTVDLLEGKILNQLIHQIDVKDIPQSRFRSKNTNSPRLKRDVGVFALFFLLLLYTLHYDTWQAMVNALPPGPLDISWSVHPSFRIVMLFLCLFLGGLSLLFLLRNFDLQHLFRKLNVNIKGFVGIEIFEEESDSTFDRYLDEVLYLFEQSGADVIVFEDLDRYEVTQIFGKLKEISDLLYQRKKAHDDQLLRELKKKKETKCQKTNQEHGQSKNQESVQQSCKEGEDQQSSKVSLNDIVSRSIPKFIYLIRDDVFTSSDRTKFFDFIIPVIPVIATGNAYDLMVNRFKGTELENAFDKHFLRDVSLYLSDLRLVHNIINEYILYQQILECRDLNRDPNRQLAMIIYKNLFPKDFERLQRGQGYVFNILNRRDELLAPKREAILQQEREAQAALKELQDEHLQDIDELNALFFPFQGEIKQIDGKSPDNNLSRKELVKLLLQADRAFYINYSSQMNPLDLATLRHQMEKNSDYQARKATLEAKEKHRIPALNAQLASLADKRLKLNTLTLSELVDVSDDRFWMLGDDNLTTSRYFPLLRYLISQGYIDEHYIVYISYFHPNSLTARDMNFRIALNIHHALGYDYALDNPSAVLEWIDDSYFSREELSNFALFNYLIEHDRIKELHRWLNSIEQRREMEPSAFDFPIALWKQTPHHAKLAGIINEKMPHWFQLWTPIGLIDGDEWCKYAIDTLFQSEDCVLEKMNLEGWLGAAISVRRNFLQFKVLHPEKLIEKFQIIGVRFSCIDFREQDAALVRRVYEENLYRLGVQTLTLWLTLYYGAPADIALRKSYTYILEKPDEPLSRWVQENITTYINALLDIEDLRFFDDPQAAEAVLNHSDIELNQKRVYISRLDTHLEMLEKITQQELWPDLLQAELVSFNWENVADYYATHCTGDRKLDEEWCNFLENGSNDLSWSKSKLEMRIGEENTNSLLDKLLECTELSLERYRAIWKTLDVKYTRVSPLELSDEKLAIIIGLHIIDITIENTEYIRQSYPDFIVDFVLSDGGAAIVELTSKGDVALTESEMIMLIEDVRMTEQVALPLLDAYSSTLSIADKTYPELIKAEIIDNHFKADDIRWLLEHYDAQSEAVQSAFIRQAKANFSLINTTVIDCEVIPITVYAACLGVMKLEQAEGLRRFLPDPNFEAVCTLEKAQTFPVTEDIHLILKYFKQNAWISSYQKRQGSYYVRPKQKEALEV